MYVSLDDNVGSSSPSLDQFLRQESTVSRYKTLADTGRVTTRDSRASAGGKSELGYAALGGTMHLPALYSIPREDGSAVLYAELSKESLLSISREDGATVPYAALSGHNDNSYLEITGTAA